MSAPLKSAALRVLCASLLVAALAGLRLAPPSALASFGFASGADAPSVVVSNSANPAQPTEANPNDLDSQAGSHPFDMTTNFKLNLDPEGNTTGEYYAKDISVDLPSGFAGSIVSVPQCPISNLPEPKSGVSGPGCPTSSQVGVAEASSALEGTKSSPNWCLSITWCPRMVVRRSSRSMW